MFRPIVFRDGTGSYSRRSYFFRRRFALSRGFLIAASLPEIKRGDAQDQDNKCLHFPLKEHGAGQGERPRNSLHPFRRAEPIPYYRNPKKIENKTNTYEKIS